MCAKTPTEPALDTPVGDLPGVGSAYVGRLERLGIRSVRDLLHYFPRKYDDLRQVRTLDELQQFGGLANGEVITLRATILAVESRRSRGGRSFVKAAVGNERGSLEAVWFNQPYLVKQLKIAQEYIFSGKLKTDYGRPSLQSPTHEPVNAEQTHVARLVPVYPETEGLSSKWLRAKIKPLLKLACDVPEELPVEWRNSHHLWPVAKALQHIHFPETPEAATAARRRFDFVQILLRQLLTQRSRQSWRQGSMAAAIPYASQITKQFVNHLPWPLTDHQRLTTHEILQDLTQTTPMMRLLQGDVGSGKTAVAAIAANQVIAAGYQVAVMAPTEVLARQHLVTLQPWFSEGTVVVLLGSDSAPAKRHTLKRIAEGSAQLVIGTHSLIQESVSWDQLGLAIVDEQHRFGVAQRDTLRGAQTPHLLTMTATPIPRSLALVAYGDQDLSTIESRPAGRLPVETSVVAPAERPNLFTKINKLLSQGQQAFVVYPVIEESVNGLKDAQTEFAKLRDRAFSDFRVGLLHGRLTSTEKEAVMRSFSEGQLDVLVATSVIEVGVDVPNATVMIIEEAQQFGLAQLHQFRGRVGRGTVQSHCYLLPGSSSSLDNERLTAMTESHSGFELAEIDLKLRGPGDLLGTKQSGFDISVQALSDPQLLKEVHDLASHVMADDPELTDYPLLRQRLDNLDLAS